MPVVQRLVRHRFKATSRPEISVGLAGTSSSSTSVLKGLPAELPAISEPSMITDEPPAPRMPEVGIVPLRFTRPHISVVQRVVRFQATFLGLN